MNKIKAAELCAVVAFALIIGGLLTEEGVYCIAGFGVSIFSLTVKDDSKKQRIQLQNIVFIYTSMINNDSIS